MAVSSAYATSPATVQQLPSWSFDPDRTQVGFRGRRLGAIWVNGHFREVRGKFYWDHDDPLGSSCVGEIDVANLHSEEPCLNTQLRAADFLDPSHHRVIIFAAWMMDRTSDTQFTADVVLTIRGATRHVSMELTYLGEWEAPVVRHGESIGRARRLGLSARGAITRRQFEQDPGFSKPHGEGAAAHANAIDITMDLEAILDADLHELDAIDLS